jgi:hypothetical protein
MIAEILSSETPIPEEYRGVEQEVSALELRVRSLVLVTEADHEAACSLERELARQIEAVKAKTNPAKSAAHEAWKKLVELENFLLKPLETAKPVLKERIGLWRLERKVEADRQAQALREQALRLAEEEALARAQRLQEKGDAAGADAALERCSPPPVVIAAAPLRTHGVKVQTRWYAEVQDLESFLRWVLDAPAERLGFVEPAMPKLNKLAQAFKDSMSVPGVKARERMV